MRVADIGIIVGSSLAVFYLLGDLLVLPDQYMLFIALLALGASNIFSSMGVYQAWRGQLFIRELTYISWSWVIIVLLVGTFTFLTKTGASFSRLWVGWTFVMSFCAMVGIRVILRACLRHIRAKGYNIRRVIIVGAGRHGQNAVKALQKERWAGLVPIAYFDDNPSLHGTFINGVEVKGACDELMPFIEEARAMNTDLVDQVWITLPLTAEEKITALQQSLRNSAANVYFLPDIFAFELANTSVSEIVGLPVMNMSASRLTGNRAVAKRLEDIVLGMVFIILFAPVLILIAIAIKLDSRGPVFFRQRRYGLDGKEFLIWKFRSMHVLEDSDHLQQARRNDARVTRVGAYLRKYSMDELPQLINVINGTMSLVGPRPHAVAHNELYRHKIPGYMSRHQLRPGMTGWAQINGYRGETEDLAAMERRIQHDLEYAKSWSIFLDLQILIQTIPLVFSRKNAY